MKSVKIEKLRKRRTLVRGEEAKEGFGAAAGRPFSRRTSKSDLRIKLGSKNLPTMVNRKNWSDGKNKE